MKTKKILGH